MGLLVLWIAHASFALLSAAAGAALLASAPRVRGARSLATLAWLPLLALHAYLTWRALALRFDLGFEHAPWLFASCLLTLHALGVVWLLVRARSGASLLGWSAGRLALAALITCGFSVTTLHVLDLEARLALAKLRVEAGLIAFELTPALPDDRSNAAPTYERVGTELFGGADFVDLDDYEDALSNRSALDAEDPKLRTLLARCAPGLAQVRPASALPYCRSMPANEHELVAVPRVLPLLGLSRLLCLEARVRVHQRDLVGAVDDVVAALRMSEHVARMPTLLALAAGTAMRTETLATALLVASDDRIGAADLARLVGPLELEFSPLAPNAARMEEAFGLAMLGSALADGEASFAGVNDRSLDWLGPFLYAPFMLEGDVRGYREVMAETLALSRASYREVAAVADDESLRTAVRRRGVLASLMAPNMVRIFLQAHQGDARAALARLALAAARERSASGSYPTAPGAWSASVVDVRVEGDGRSIRLLRTDSAVPGAELEVSLPPGPTP